MKILMTAKETAVYLNVSIYTIRHWTSFKTIPFVKLGHTVRYDREQIDLWIEKRSHKGRVHTRMPVAAAA